MENTNNCQHQLMHKCGNCGKIHTHENRGNLISINGIDFCSECAHNFESVYDPYVGTVILRK